MIEYFIRFQFRGFMLTDYHVHTAYSDDSTYPMENVIKDAIRLNLSEIALTDHVDYGVKPDHNSDKMPLQFYKGQPVVNVDYPNYFADIARMKEKYGHQIRILAGLEFGIQTHTVPRYEQLFSQWPLEFVIISIHQVEDLEFWTQDFQRGRSQGEFQLRQYQELLDVVKIFKNYSVIGHIDSIKRYDLYGEFPFVEYRDLLKEIFDVIIADGKGIEVNTSNERYNLPGFSPSTDILRLYRECGGEIITVGSDSHAPEHLASYIKVARDYLSDLGFKYTCSYLDNKPIFHRL